MEQTEKISNIQKAINQSLILSMLIYPSSFSTLSHYLVPNVSEFQSLSSILKQQSFTQEYNDVGSILIKMNPLLLDDITEKENEINSIIQEDNVDQLKLYFLNHLLSIDSKDRKGISLIEKCVFFNSKKCIKFLLEENASTERRYMNSGYREDYYIGLMEYGAIKGNQNIINFCLEKKQMIKIETLILGLAGHQNKLVKWMIEDEKLRNHYDEIDFPSLLGVVDNIDFFEKLIKKRINTNSMIVDKRRKNILIVD